MDHASLPSWMRRTPACCAPRPLINGEWVEGRQLRPWTDPPPGEALAEVPNLGRLEAEAAIAAAANAWPTWKRQTAKGAPPCWCAGSNRCSSTPTIWP